MAIIREHYKYYLTYGKGEKVMIGGMLYTKPNIISVFDDVKEALAEAKRLSDEATYGDIDVLYATGISEEGVLENMHPHTLFLAPENRTTPKFFIRRVVGNKAKMLGSFDTLEEAEAKALEIKAKDDKSIIKKILGGKGVLAIVCFHYKKDGTRLGCGRQYRLYK